LTHRRSLRRFVYLAALLAAAAILGCGKADETRTKSGVTPVATGVFMVGGQELPPEIAQKVPQSMTGQVWAVRMTALDCNRMDQIVRANEHPAERLAKIYQEPSRWNVEFVGRNGSLDSDANGGGMLMEIRGESVAQLRSLVPELTLKIDRVEAPPQGTGCIYAYLSPAPLQGFPPAFHITVPANAKPGDAFSARQGANEDAIGFLNGTIQVPTMFEFEAPGGYEYSVGGTPQLYAGRHRWLRLNSLQGWKLHIEPVR
jgi:hypothetical protein